jgi:microcystin-dependent protein
MVSLTHEFVSAKADGTDSTLVKPSAWDAEHTFVTATDTVVLGRSAGAGAGPVQELPMSSVFQPGQVSIFAGATIPTGWLLCDGSLLNRADQPALFTAIGAAYNIGGEATTQFRLPDCRGRVIAMLDGGTGRLPGYTTLGVAGGANQVGGLPVNVTVPQIGVSVGGAVNLYANPSGAEVAAAASGSGASSAAHDHAVTGNVNLGGQTNSAVNASGGTTAGFGIVQPTIVMNMMIKT